MSAVSQREFELGDILSITTGRLVSRSHIDGVYNILNYMTGDTLFTHQLPRASRECAPRLLEQHPDLAEIVVPDDLEGEEAVYSWLYEIEAQYGKTRFVRALDPDDHTAIDPLTELASMVGPDKIIPVVLPDPAPREDA